MGRNIIVKNHGFQFVHKSLQTFAVGFVLLIVKICLGFSVLLAGMANGEVLDHSGGYSA